MFERLDPEFAVAAAPLLDLRTRIPKPAVGDVATRRNAINTFMSTFSAQAPTDPDVEKTQHQIQSYDNVEITIFHHHLKTSPTPPSSPPSPAIIHVHGGGMVAGSAAIVAPEVRALVSQTSIPFFSVEYRLAPENPHPTPVEDVYAAIQWLKSPQTASTLHIDPSRIAVMGESAGGGIAAGAALLSRDRNLQPPLAKQFLICPMLDSRNINPVDAGLAPYLFWDVDSNITGWQALLGPAFGTLQVSPYASPAHVESVQGLPPTYIDVGDLDLFLDEDVEYARRLQAAGVEVECHVYAGVPHGFDAMSRDTGVARLAVANRIRAMKSF